MMGDSRNDAEASLDSINAAYAKHERRPTPTVKGMAPLQRAPAPVVAEGSGPTTSTDEE